MATLAAAPPQQQQPAAAAAAAAAACAATTTESGEAASLAVAHLTVCRELACEPCDAFVEAVRAGSAALKLTGGGLSDSTLFATASLLPYCAFEELDLAGLRLSGAEAWQALLEAAAKCRALQVVSLKGCALGAALASDEARAQAAALLGACAAGVVDVSQNGLVRFFLCSGACAV